MRYDALKAPDPAEWLELDEQERIGLVREYHRRNKLPVGQDAKFQGTSKNSTGGC
jgi:hypothetical protein